MLDRFWDFLGLIPYEAPCLLAGQHAQQSHLPAQQESRQQGGRTASTPAGSDSDRGFPGLASPSSETTSRGQRAQRDSSAPPQSRPYKRRIDEISDSGSERLTRPSLRNARLHSRPDVVSRLRWLVRVGLAAWERDKSGEQSAMSREGTGSSEGAPASPVEPPHRPHKRPRACRDSPPAKSGESSDSTKEEDEEEEGEEEEEGSQPFACPFYRHDPSRHRSCMGLPELTGPDAVRYHVLSRHRKPLHCPRCHAVFAKHADRDKHVVYRLCGSPRKRRADLLVGVSAAQAAELAACDDDRGSKGRPGRARAAEEAQIHGWHQIWDILFPGQARPEPASVFVTGSRESTAVALRKFWGENGAGIIAGALEKLGVSQAKREQWGTSLVALQACVLQQMLASLDREALGDKGATS